MTMNELRQDLIRYGKIISDISDGLNRSRIFAYNKEIYCMVERNGDIVYIIKGGRVVLKGGTQR